VAGSKEVNLMRTIQITIQVPDNANVNVTQGGGGGGSRPFVAKEPPPEPNGYCPEHEVAWKLVPAGVSKNKFDDDGNPKRYNAFWACPERGCNEKPPKENVNVDELPF
jgi:hypothetical protein